MAQLIQMRQRIKAIETIKKITHAMRLIAMSTHLRLRSKKIALDSYMHEITALFTLLNSSGKKWDHPLLQKPSATHKKTLFIVVGSQKGLCGNFNTEICTFFLQELEKNAVYDYDIIVIGKKIAEYLKQKTHVVKEFHEFTALTLPSITQSIIAHIKVNAPSYTSVIVFSSYPKTFFTQKPQHTTIIPLAENRTIAHADDIISEYIWEQPSEEIMNLLIDTMLYTNLYHLLFQSLIAEQASRFIAMDNSTRNASTLLEEMKLNYNKLRQSKITRELTDLAGSFF